MNSLDSGGRLKDLEGTCEDLRRRLSEEKQVKDNFEDLLTALKGELQHSHNERDNLREEIVPQLRARVEGLESQAAQHEQFTYEHSKIQQELQNLKNENSNLINTQKLHKATNKFNSIGEESGTYNQRASVASFGLSRSFSVAGPSSRSRPVSMSVKNTESRETLIERVKDVELQRDALHKALKALLERQEHQNRENQKKLKLLEAERDRATSMPKRAGYDKDVSSLRDEINVLHRRADEAIDQKWQCEKGLSSIKMDLDRAEQEIASLRGLLQENDVTIPQLGGARPISGQASSASLELAYKNLQNAYSESLERIKRLQGPGMEGEDTAMAIKQLEKTLAATVSERDFAVQEAASLRQQKGSLQSHIGHEMELAEELRKSSERVEELAAQVRQQLGSNNTLRQRLAETIERGEKDQQANAQRIIFMQGRLKTLEDSLNAAQHASEERISRHEDEMLEVHQSHNLQLQRVRDGGRSPRVFAPKSPLSPMFANTTKAPQLASTTSGRAQSISEQSKVDILKARVVELEMGLADADQAMEEVVQRMNMAQMEVMELQNEREAATRETRKLQKLVEAEKLMAFEGKFAKLSS